MHSKALTSATLILLITHLTAAHVKLEQPVPYGAATLDTNPLQTSGADWPCKQRPDGYTITQWNIMPINAPQTITFIGQATHGGGSCQIALTKDTPPNKESMFKVIKSIEGGCPSTNAGNVGTNALAKGADAFNFAIPDVVQPANYTLAWTWFNKIGDREMYMNCAPVTVTAPKQKGHPHQRPEAAIEQRADGFSALPNLFRANSGNGCSTAASGTVLKIPDANIGKNVQKIGTEPLTPPVGTCGDSAAQAAQNPQSEPVIRPAAPVQSAASPSPPASKPETSAAPPAPSQVAYVAPAIPTTPPAPQMPAAPQASPATPASRPATSPTVPSSSTGKRDTPGKSVCSPDGKAWGNCRENHQVMFHPVAMGTKCDPNLGVEVPA